MSKITDVIPEERQKQLVRECRIEHVLNMNKYYLSPNGGFKLVKNLSTDIIGKKNRNCENILRKTYDSFGLDQAMKISSYSHFEKVNRHIIFHE
jgi:hypothetical protein